MVLPGSLRQSTASGRNMPQHNRSTQNDLPRVIDVITPA
jgi:hypothetical protein